MNPTTLRTLIGIFLIAHGFMTMSLATVPVPAQGGLHTPFFPSWWRDNVDSTWPASRLGWSNGLVRTTGWILWTAALVLFAAAGAGLLGIPGLSNLWQIFAAAGGFISLILLALFWHPWLVLGVLINLGILGGVITGWFSRWFPIQ
jgi:hypothetical protein